MRFRDNFSGSACCLTLMMAGVYLTGCGPRGPVIKYADVVGKVSYKGEPLKMGTVSFQPASGARAVGEIKPDGTYSLKGVVGPNTVMIESHEPGAQPGGPDAPKMMKSDPKTYIPMTYASSQSGLKFDVKDGAKNQADFDLK